jgi:hypothetical protein
MDKELQDECYTFVIINRKPQADDNCHDDVVMADAICCQMLKEPSQIKTDTDVITINYDSELY